MRSLDHFAVSDARDVARSGVFGDSFVADLAGHVDDEMRRSEGEHAHLPVGPDPSRRERLADVAVVAGVGVIGVVAAQTVRTISASP